MMTGELSMKTSITLWSIFLVLFIWSCSDSATVNNVGSPGLNIAGTPNVSSAGLPEKKLPSNSGGDVLSDSKDRTKKGGWRVPKSDKRKIENTSVNSRPTEEGGDAEVTRTHYSFEIPWSYTEDFADLRGPLKLESEFFMELKVNGKVFMYAIFAKEVRTRAPSNNEPHVDTFVYRIRDDDGDGIFETLVGGDEETKVPKWVLK